jgi:hypothetical protein
MVTFLRDRRGSDVVQFAIILPALLLIGIGFFKLWEALSVWEHLRAGTYLATRYVSLHPDQAEDAEKFICYELWTNTFYQKQYPDRWGSEECPGLSVEPITPGRCRSTFKVKADLRWPVDFPLLATQVNLHAEYEGHVECAPQG